MILQTLLTYGHSVSRHVITIEYFLNDLTFNCAKITMAQTKLVLLQHSGDLRFDLLD